MFSLQSKCEQYAIAVLQLLQDAVELPSDFREGLQTVDASFRPGPLAHIDALSFEKLSMLSSAYDAIARASTIYEDVINSADECDSESDKNLAMPWRVVKSCIMAQALIDMVRKAIEPEHIPSDSRVYLRLTPDGKAVLVEMAQPGEFIRVIRHTFETLGKDALDSVLSRTEYVMELAGEIGIPESAMVNLRNEVFGFPNKL